LSLYQCTRCFPSLKPVNARHSFSTALARTPPDDLSRDVQGLAESGIEKWTVDMGRMTMTFYDKAGIEIAVEQIS
jgi:uncharacterized protein YbcV (DUF1398 family)